MNRATVSFGIKKKKRILLFNTFNTNQNVRSVRKYKLCVW